MMLKSYEDSSWLYTFFAPRDMISLIIVLGGPDEFIRGLQYTCPRLPAFSPLVTSRHSFGLSVSLRWPPWSLIALQPLLHLEPVQ